MTASPACDWHHPHLPCPAFAWVEHGRADQPCRVSALWPPRSQSPGGVCLPEVLAAEMDDLRDSMAALLWRLLPLEAGADWHMALDVNSRHYAPAGTTGQGRFRGRVGTPLAPASRLISLSSLVRLVETGRGLPGSKRLSGATAGARLIDQQRTPALRPQDPAAGSVWAALHPHAPQADAGCRPAHSRQRLSRVGCISRRD